MELLRFVDRNGLARRINPNHIVAVIEIDGGSRIRLTNFACFDTDQSPDDVSRRWAAEMEDD